MSLRLNQFLARHLDISRRQADQLIASGLVEVNGELGQFHQRIEAKDKVRVFIREKWQELETEMDKELVVLMYKPIFCVTTRRDPQKRKTFLDFLPKKFHHLKTAGRLDYLSEGLLVLSNNGDLIFRLTHPSQGTLKKYLVASKEPLSVEVITQLENGLVLPQTNQTLQPMLLEKLQAKDLQRWQYLKLETKHHWYEFTLKEGKKNQIRRALQVFGYQVCRLIRVQHGPYFLTKKIKKQGFVLLK